MQNRSDLIGSVVLIFIGIGVVIGSIRLHVGTPLMPQPGFFPFLGGLLLAGLSLVLLVQGWLGRDKAPRQPLEAGAAFGEWRRPLILVVSMGVYTAVLEWMGYVLPTMALAVLILRVLRVTSWKVLILTSVGLSVGTYVLFGRLLGIDLPAGVLPFLG
jgi:putative tricarboxylic transport membrane protein